MNTGKLIRCYNRNQSAFYLTSAPIWLKRYHKQLIISTYLLYAIAAAYFEFHNAVNFVLIGLTMLFILLYRTVFITKHLKKKYAGVYNIKMINEPYWTETMTYKIRKARIKNCIGANIGNEPVMNRIKAQLNDEINNNKKSLQSPVPVMGVITVLLATYIGFKIKNIEAIVGANPKEVGLHIKDFYTEIILVIGGILIGIIAYKPKLETLLNKYSLHLTELLRTIQTLEIEHYSNIPDDKKADD